MPSAFANLGGKSILTFGFFKKPSTLPNSPSPSASKVTGGIKLTWGAVTGAAGYLVYRYTPGSARWTLLQQTQALTITDATVVSGVAYEYALAATNGAGVGGWSTPTTALTF